MGYNKLKEFEKIIEQYQNQLIRFAFFKTGSYEDAQDIVQNVFIRSFEKQFDFQSLNNTKSFLYRSVSNACIDYARLKKLDITSIDAISHPIFCDEKYSTELIEEFQRIEYLLKDLPVEQRNVLKLRVVEELEFKEIADVLEIPIPTAKSRYKYAIEKIKSKMLMKKEAANEL